MGTQHFGLSVIKNTAVFFVSAVYQTQGELNDMSGSSTRGLRGRNPTSKHRDIFIPNSILERYRYRNQSLHYMNIDDDCIISDPWNVCNFVKLPEYYEQNSKLSDFIEIEPDWVDISKFINSRHKLWFSTLISVWFYVAAWSSETFENRVFLSIYP